MEIADKDLILETVNCQGTLKTQCHILELLAYDRHTVSEFEIKTDTGSRKEDMVYSVANTRTKI